MTLSDKFLQQLVLARSRLLAGHHGAGSKDIRHGHGALRHRRTNVWRTFSTILLEGLRRRDSAGVSLLAGKRGRLLERLLGRRRGLNVGPLQLHEQCLESFLLSVVGLTRHAGAANWQAGHRSWWLSVKLAVRVFLRSVEEGREARRFTTSSLGLGGRSFLLRLTRGASNVKSSGRSELEEELIGANFDGRGRCDSWLLGLDCSFSESWCLVLSRGFTACLHALHELLEVLLGMASSLLSSRLVEPFRLALGPMITTVPATLIVTAAGLLLGRCRIPVPISPALGAVDALASRHGRLFTGSGGIILEPGLRLAPAKAISGSGFSLVVVLVLFMVVEVALGSLSVAFSIAVTGSPVVGEPIATTGTHATMEALSALMSEALAGLHRAPSLIVLVIVATTTEVAVSRVAEPLRLGGITITVAEIEAAWGIGVLEVFVVLKGLATVVAQGCRSKGSSRGAKDDLVWVCD